MRIIILKGSKGRHGCARLEFQRMKGKLQISILSESLKTHFENAAAACCFGRREPVLRRAPAERNAIMLAIVFGFSRGKEIGSFQKKRHSKKRLFEAASQE